VPGGAGVKRMCNDGFLSSGEKFGRGVDGLPVVGV
jgi:hypothetical protein